MSTTPPERLTPKMKQERAEQARKDEEAKEAAALAHERSKAELHAAIKLSRESIAATCEPGLGPQATPAEYAAHRALKRELDDLNDQGRP